MRILPSCIAAGAFLLSLSAAQAQSVATDANGMAFYTYDKDSGGTSTCYNLCAAAWPPVLGEAGSKTGSGWTMVKRNNGSMQWAHNGKPIYYYIGDRKPGDVTGDGKDGVWHVLTK